MLHEWRRSDSYSSRFVYSLNLPSKGKGKGNYLTSVAKQAKTAFLHGPTVWKSPIVGIEPATFRSESAALTTAPRDPTPTHSLVPLVTNKQKHTRPARKPTPAGELNILNGTRTMQMKMRMISSGLSSPATSRQAKRPSSTSATWK